MRTSGLGTLGTGFFVGLEFGNRDRDDLFEVDSGDYGVDFRDLSSGSPILNPRSGERLGRVSPWGNGHR